MTLVVTDVSRHGIVAVGDSALTARAKGERGRVLESLAAVKVFHIPRASVGLAAWGNFGVDGRRLDYWLYDFVQKATSKEPFIVASELAEALNSALEPDYKASGFCREMRRGVHVAGFKDRLPELYHVHMGDEEGPYHELRVHNQPLGDSPNPEDIADFLSRRSVHLRNGLWRDFVFAFDRAAQARGSLPAFDDNLAKRCTFFGEVILAVAADYRALGIPPFVNTLLSSLAFDYEGSKVDLCVQLDGPELLEEIVDATETLAA